MSREVKVEYIQHCGNDLIHANSARVSYGKKSEWDIDPISGLNVLKPADVNLLQFLGRGMRTADFQSFIDDVTLTAANVNAGVSEEELETLKEKLWKFRDTGEHSSPFNHSFMTVHVEAPITVARQLVKHKFQIWNEISGRYIQFNEGDINIPNQFREKIADKKQGSGDFITDERYEGLKAIFIDNAKSTYGNYREAIDIYNLTEEQARELLPLGLFTEWYWSGTFGSWASMLRLRLASDAQYETRQVANHVSEILKELFPVSYDVMVARKYK